MDRLVQTGERGDGAPARQIAPDFTPDFTHVDTWVFDLDNTLYPASSNLFAQIDARMTAYLSSMFGVSADEARKLQKDYYQIGRASCRERV